MAHDTMRGHLKAFAATRLAPLKDYFVPPLDTHSTYHHHHHHGHGHHPSSEISQVDDAKKHSWAHFTSRFSRRSNSDPGSMTSTECIVLLPGWASRRYRARTGLSGRAGSAPYDIELFVSGYVVKHKAVNTLSRSQRAVLRLAKRFASLPKLPDLYHHGSEDTLLHETNPSTESVEALLSTLRQDTTDEVEGHVLHQSPKEMNPDLSPTPTSATSSTGFSVSITPSPITPCELASASQPKVVLAKNEHLHVHRWHSNLETRLQPFWAGVLSHRTLRVSVQPHSVAESESESASPSELEFLEQALAASVVVTDAEGAFKMRLVIPWENLCARIPTALGDPHREYDFAVTAELMPSPSPPPSSPRPSTEPYPSVSSSIPSAIMRERVPLTHSPIRVISDIDDTVKLSGIHCGARAVFHNVFVKDLEDNLIPGMGEWYTEMWRRGVRFHYVSNGPFELLPVIQDFFCLAKLPTGSVRLRSYGTRSLFSDLLSAPSDRKRDGVLEVMTSFPHSQFILIGDSGEQDLELYATVARDRPEQVLCIFIRDVNTYEDGEGGIDDPTGIRAREGGKKRSPWGMSLSRGGWVSPKSSTSTLPSSLSLAVSRAPSETTDDYFSSKTMTPSGAGTPRPYTDTLYAEPESYYNPPQASVTPSHLPSLSRLTLSESERKRMNLQLRLWKACAEIPTNVVIRIFRDPLECVEAFQVIDPIWRGRVPRKDIESEIASALPLC